MAGVDAKPGTRQSAAEGAAMGAKFYQTEIKVKTDGSEGTVTVIYPASMLRDFGPGREIQAHVPPAQK